MPPPPCAQGRVLELAGGRRTAPPPLSLYGQLLWREFFYTAATNNPRFDKMEGNPICVRIPWDRNPKALAKWAEAKTGFPWIDAIMTQLRTEGWIHHLARHAVACFLTRGDLWVSWEEGMKVFEELLLDADWSVNAGSWMWLSCSSFFQQFFHCYCPVGFGRRTDPNGDFISTMMTSKMVENRSLQKASTTQKSLQPYGGEDWRQRNIYPIKSTILKTLWVQMMKMMEAVVDTQRKQ
ncbi:hypothetical protein CRUP_035254 [Coryphaenoides rupestris]|nr:hypothetical protein CRUP_035254 [Coryphaenoides rupestris]